MTESNASPHTQCTEHSGLVGRLNLIIVLLVGAVGLITWMDTRQLDQIESMRDDIKTLSTEVMTNRSRIDSQERFNQSIMQNIDRLDRLLEKERTHGKTIYRPD